MDNLCIFCEKINNKSEIIWENNFFYAMFDSFPVSPGHALIIPKTHTVDISFLNDDMWASLKKVIAEVILIIENTNLKETYAKMLQNHISEVSDWFIKKAIENPRINTKPDAYNHTG